MFTVVYYHRRTPNNEPQVIEVHCQEYGGLELSVAVGCLHAPCSGPVEFEIAIPRLSNRELEECSDFELATRLSIRWQILEFELIPGEQWTSYACTLLRGLCPAGFRPILTSCEQLRGDELIPRQPVYRTGRRV